MRRPFKTKKLLKGELVEVRQKEGGLRGSWHEGIVIEAKALKRKVKYKHLLDETESHALVETIGVSHVVEGWKHEDWGRSKLRKRAWIRPSPPVSNIEVRWNYGLCVDAFYNDAWWEGVIMDESENSIERSIFFPDEGDELTVCRENLRLSQDWDEKLERWSLRGHWMLATFRSLCHSKGFSIKEVWCIVRIDHLFLNKVGEWTHGKKNDWRECLGNIFQLLGCKSPQQLIIGLNGPRHFNLNESLQSEAGEPKISSQVQTSNETHDSSLIENHPGVPPDSANDVIENTGNGIDNLVVVGDRLIVTPDNANEVTEHIENGINNFLDSSWSDLRYQIDSIGKELCFASSDGEDRGVQLCRRSSKESHKAIVADAKELTSPACRKSCNCEISGMEHIDCLGRLLLNNIVNMANTKHQRGHMDKVLCNGVVMAASLKDASESNQNQWFKSPPAEANSKDKSNCIDMILSKHSTRDEINTKNGTELSHQISRKCKLFNVAAGGNLLEKHNAGLQSTSTQIFKPSASRINPEDCLAALNYDAYSNSSKEIRAKAKSHLLHQGWRLELKPRISSARKDALYISPNGNIYYSLHQACLAWREEQKVKGMIDGHCKDSLEVKGSKAHVLAEGSASLSFQEALLRVKGNTTALDAKIPKRPWRISLYQQSATNDSNNDERNGDGSKKNNRSKQLLSRNKRLQGHGNKKVPPILELSHQTKTHQFLSNSIAQDFKSRKKRSRQAPLLVSGWSNKKHKINLEGLREVQKQKELESSCHIWQRKDKFALMCQMPELPSIPVKSNDSSSCQDKLTNMFDLLWLIENGVVAKSQQVFFLYGKRGWITSEGILCACCKRVYSLTSFEVHAGSVNHKFTVNLRLDDGRSLAQCQMQAMKKRMTAPSKEKQMRALLKQHTDPLDEHIDPSEEHDEFCFVCRGPGDLQLCDRCTRSFHAVCVCPEELPGSEEWVKWFCPNCRCNKCGGGEFSNDKKFTESTGLFCDQCECLYHVGCLDGIGMPRSTSYTKGKWFCSEKCSEIFSKLRNLVGKVNPVGHEGLYWTLLRSAEEDKDLSSDKILTKRKLSVALSVMHESFSPMIEYRTGKDCIEEIIFNRGCKRNLLKFQGFYTMILEKDDELISVVTVRIHGKKVAELPLIATRAQYRWKGMCRLLVKELENLLNSLHIEKIILPAVSELRTTWKKSFGFEKMTSIESFELLKLNILHFEKTTVLQKMLMGASPEQERLTERDFWHDRRYKIHENSIKEIVCHPRKTPMDDDVNELCKVNVGTTRTRVVRQVKYKVGYSCSWKAHKPMSSVGHNLCDKKIKRRMKNKYIFSDKCPVIPPPNSVGSSEEMDIQSGKCEITKSDEEKSTICIPNLAIADGNFSNIKLGEHILDRPDLVNESYHVSFSRGNVCVDLHAPSCNTNLKENHCGHLIGQDSFKYVYMRRRKQICTSNAFSGEIPSMIS